MKSYNIETVKMIITVMVDITKLELDMLKALSRSDVIYKGNGKFIIEIFEFEVDCIKAFIDENSGLGFVINELIYD